MSFDLSESLLSLTLQPLYRHSHEFETTELEKEDARPQFLSFENFPEAYDGSLLIHTLEGIPGVKCPHCAAAGETEWVARGKLCPRCKNLCQ
ncbi:hypothetical protein EX30DRAFT_374258 [Ascodesmis nigricans]|uniref:Uncharacterized protein n=1 Tax=Ascodesmis nigricans TaxID=341454 RepID=A0A4S2MLU0_9PEZI|nr:hypothetical protein EX30DRAFT_374258 [Ascodesmis nigricans]